MPEHEGIVTTPSKIKYYLPTLLKAIDEFNSKCPKNGGKFVSDHVGHAEGITHITNSIQYKDGTFTANIDILNNEIKNAKIKPIIKIPLRLGSGIQERRVERVLGIINILLEY